MLYVNYYQWWVLLRFRARIKAFVLQTLYDACNESESFDNEKLPWLVQTDNGEIVWKLVCWYVQFCFHQSRQPPPLPISPRLDRRFRANYTPELGRHPILEVCIQHWIYTASGAATLVIYNVLHFELNSSVTNGYEIDRFQNFNFRETKYSRLKTFVSFLVPILIFKGKSAFGVLIIEFESIFSSWAKHFHWQCMLLCCSSLPPS